MELFGKQYNTPGTMPGVLTESVSGKFTISLRDYSEDNLTEISNIEPDKCRAFIDSPNITWIHVQGEPTTNTLSELGEVFGLHSLHLEDVLNTGQRPKLDRIGDWTFLILCLPIIENEHVVVKQVGIFYCDRTVISFCAGELNPFTLIYERLHKAIGKMRRRGADYLFYTLIDTIIDFGFPILEFYAERIESIEETLIDKPNETALQDIHSLRRELLLLRRRLWPHREVINEIIRDDGEIKILPETQIYFRDCYDHTIAILEFLETYREMTAGMLEVYLSSLSYRLNEVMRVLTIIATLFIPPTFVVGVYGMNFDRGAGPLSMPELSWPYGYVLVWSLIVSMTAGLLFYFKRKNWF